MTVANEFSLAFQDELFNDEKDDTNASITKVDQTTETVPRMKKKKLSYQELELKRAYTLITSRLYSRAVSILCKLRQGFKKAIFSLCENTIREEIQKFGKRRTSSFIGVRGGGGFYTKLSELENFNCNDSYTELKSVCPTLTNILTSSLTTIRSVKTLSSANKSKKSGKPLVGCISSIILYSRQPRKFNNLQQINSLQLWMAGCKREVFARFSHLSLCVGIHATRNAVDRIRTNYNSNVIAWKEAISDYLLLQPLESVDISSNSTDQSSNLDQDTIIETKDPSTFSICFDNVNQKVTVRHQTRDNKNKMFNMVQSYAALDRIPSLHLSDEMPSSEDILNIPLQVYIPTQEDEMILKSEMSTLISRILCKYNPVFDELKDHIVWHINHQYSEESKKKSVLVPLGILDKDESKVGDTIDIMENYQQYLPVKPDGEPFKIPLHADGLSCERCNDAQSARINASTSWDQLQGFVPNIQEWHKRCLLLQDVYDLLFKPSSSREKGTLSHLKNYFDHRSVTTNTKDSFSQNEEFLEFCTEGYVTLTGMFFMEISEIKDMPSNFPEDIEGRIEFLKNITTRITDMVFLTSNSIVQKILCEEADEALQER